MKFCGGCGAPLGAVPATATAKFATPRRLHTQASRGEDPHVSKAALEGERKQVTVLFADVVGFEHALGAPRSRGRPHIMDRLLRAPHPRRASLRGHDQSVHGRRHHGPVRRADRPRGPRDPGAPGRPGDPDGRRRVRRARSSGASGCPSRCGSASTRATVVVRPDRRQPPHGLHRPGRHDEPRRPAAADGPARGDLGGGTLLPHRQCDLRVAPGRTDHGQGARHRPRRRTSWSDAAPSGADSTSRPSAASRASWGATSSSSSSSPAGPWPSRARGRSSPWWARPASARAG